MVKHGRLWAMGLFLLLAGCASPSATPTPTPSVHGFRPEVLYEDAFTDGGRLDVLCALGGDGPLERKDGRVREGASKIQFSIEMDPTYSGGEFGYAIDSDEPTWLAPVRGTAQQEIDVPPGSYENDTATRWVFWLRMSVPEAPQDCYTGGGTGDMAFRIETR